MTTMTTTITRRCEQQWRQNINIESKRTRNVQVIVLWLIYRHCRMSTPFQWIGPAYRTMRSCWEILIAWRRRCAVVVGNVFVCCSSTLVWYLLRMHWLFDRFDSMATTIHSNAENVFNGDHQFMIYSSGKCLNFNFENFQNQNNCTCKLILMMDLGERQWCGRLFLFSSDPFRKPFRSVSPNGKWAHCRKPHNILTNNLW